MSITVAAPVPSGNSTFNYPPRTRPYLAALLPPEVAERAWPEHLYDRTAGPALRVLAALPDTAWYDAVSRIHIDFEALLGQDWRSLQDRLLIRVAASLYGSPFASASVADLADLTPEYAVAVDEALAIARDGFERYVPLDVPYPKYVVQSVGCDRFQVVPVDPRFNERPVEGGADLVSFEQAAALRDRLNLEAMTAV